MPDDLIDKIIFLNASERGRLAAWISRLERVKAINRGRWWQLCEGSTGYLSQRELAHLNDVAIPHGCALDIISGGLSSFDAGSGAIL